MTLVNYFSSSIVFWLAWIIIPVLMEIIPAIGGFFILLKKALTKKDEPLTFYPEITVIIPVYNSAATLRSCLESIYLSDYPHDLIKILLVNNQGNDNSFEVFSQFQSEFSSLYIQWLNARQGKSKALNLALFNSDGKYIVHIDSDGRLHPQALKNIVIRFEQNTDIDCLTGSVLTDPALIEDKKGFFKRLLGRIEFCEYCQAFLAGRNFQSELDSIFTLSGAFSAFRKSTILKTQLYNTDTVSEDTHVTFQIRKLLKKKVRLCENAFFFVDPIEGFNKLYTQRQRWQRGELEVAHIFLSKHQSVLKGFITNFALRLLMYDHTFAFPRMIWYFALICLVFMNYSMRLIIVSMALIFFLYISSSYLYYFNVLFYLRGFKDLRKYYRNKWYIIAILPLFNFVVFWIRFAGIINSIKGESSWKTKTFTEEWRSFKAVVSSDFSFLTNKINKIKSRVNNE